MIRSVHSVARIAAAALPLVLVATPALAIDLSPLTAMICSVVDALTGPLGRGAGILAVAATGFIFLYGRMQIPLAVTILVGAAIVFGAPTILEGLAGQGGCS